MTRRQWATHAQETLSKVGAKVLGVALNRLKPGSSGYYYYYHYSSGEDGGDASDGKRRRKPRGLGRWLPRLS